MTLRMDSQHPRWEEFLDRLTGPEGCNFQEDLTWSCHGGYDKRYTEGILTKMGDIDIPASLAYFESRGGHCDCEIVFNLGGS